MSPDEAKDAILAVFKSVWDPTGYPAVYTDVPGDKPTSATVWARATIKHATGGQRTVGGDIGSRHFTAEGTVFVQIFAPVGDGSTACYQAAKPVLDAYRDSRHPNVWFRDARVTEADDDGAFSQVNVLATFSYDDVR